MLVFKTSNLVHYVAYCRADMAKCPVGLTAAMQVVGGSAVR